MFMACGVGAFIAAIFHVMTHAFFKALLFLGSGSVIHGMHHEQDMRRMGNLRKYMPITFITMMAGWLAICGIIPFAGFFSKDEILYKTFAATNLPAPWNYVFWGVGLFTAVLTAVYMTRLMWMTFYGDERFHLALPAVENPTEPSRAEENAFAIGDAYDKKVSHGHDLHDEHAAHDDEDDHDEEHHELPKDFHPHESPINMWLPLAILAVLSVVGGLVGIPYAISSLVGAGDVNVFERTLEPIIYSKADHKTTEEEPSMKSAAESREAKPIVAESKKEVVKTEEHKEHNTTEISTERLLAGLSVLLALSGIGIGIAVFGKEPLRKLPRILEDKWRIDELYNGYIVDPLTGFSIKGLWQGFDLGVIDGIVNGAGYFVSELGNVVRRVQVGFVRSYAAFILFGALIVIGYFIYYGYKLISF
jgi:NADH-quinone oxidoreductase subunit L